MKRDLHKALEIQYSFCYDSMNESCLNISNANKCFKVTAALPPKENVRSCRSLQISDGFQ